MSSKHTCRQNRMRFLTPERSNGSRSTCENVGSREAHREMTNCQTAKMLKQQKLQFLTHSGSFVCF